MLQSLLEMSELPNTKVFVLHLIIPVISQLPFSEAILTVKHKKKFCICIKAVSDKQQITRQQQISLVLHPSILWSRKCNLHRRVHDKEYLTLVYELVLILLKKIKVLVTTSRNLKHSKVRKHQPKGSPFIKQHSLYSQKHKLFLK